MKVLEFQEPTNVREVENVKKIMLTFVDFFKIMRMISFSDVVNIIIINGHIGCRD